MQVRWGALCGALIVTFASMTPGRPARAQARPPTYQAQAAWALHLLEQARYGEAADAAQQLVTMNPNAAPSYQSRGTLALFIGSIARAQADFQIAALRSPEDPATHYGLALCALFSRRLDRAEAELTRAHQAQNLTDAQAADVDTALAYVHFLRGDLAGARQWASKPDPAHDPFRQELTALITARTDSKAGAALLAGFLETPSGAPRVREEDGLRPLFESAPAMIEPSVVVPPLQRMYAARLADRMAAADRQAGKTTAVSGTVTLGAEIKAAPATALITFFVDGQMAAMVNTAPYRFRWDTAQVPNGQHTIRIEATDQAGSVLSAQTRAVRVLNKNHAAQYGGHGDLTPRAYEAVETRLWGLLRLRPARKVAEWTLAENAARQGDRADADAHRLIAAALDPDYKDGRRAARALFRGAAPRLARVASARPDALWMGSPARKEVALTFDDGPSPQKTPALLEALEKAHAPATFFVVGSRAEMAPALIRRMAADGDEVENHSYTHPNMAQTVPAAAEGEILRTSVLIRALTGRQPHFFRPPGGNASPTVLGLAHAYGLATAFWTVDALHAEEDASRSGLINYVLKHLRPGAIILLHNGTDVTTAAVPGLVSALRARGYKLITLAQMTSGGARPDAPKQMRE